jgi:cytochrome c oxidase subunit 2
MRRPSRPHAAATSKESPKTVSRRRQPATRGPRVRLALATTAAVLLAGCAPETITKTGHETASLYNIVLVMATVVFVGVEAAIIYNAIRYRRRRGDGDTLPEQIHGNRSIEVLWTAIPAVIILALFVMSMKVMVDVNHEAPAPLTVKVTGFQWQWSFDYFKGPDANGKIEPLGVTVSAGGQTEPPTLVLPVGQRIHFIEVSNDVIHSFFVPDFFFKRDVVPGRTNTFDIPEIDPSKTGMYHGQCAELCGDFHNAMTFNLLAVKQDRFQIWLTNEAERQKKLGACSPNGTALQIAAKNIHFDKTCLAAPANQPFTIEFDNEDPGVPHNVEIYTDKSAQTRLGGATGIQDVVTGPAKATYDVDPLKPGSYFFQCDVHPTAMSGSFVVK